MNTNLLRKFFWKNKNHSILQKRDFHIANIFSLLAFIIAFWWNYLIILDYIYLWFIVILFAFLFDILDWYLARKYNSKSLLWKELDTFCDIFIYLVPIVFIYLQIYSFSFLFLFSSTLLFFTGLFRLSFFSNSWLQTKNNKKYYIGMPVYFLFILNILLFSEINYIIFNILIFIFSLLMISNIAFRKANIFISLLYFVFILFLSFLFFFWTL